MTRLNYEKINYLNTCEKRRDRLVDAWTEIFEKSEVYEQIIERHDELVAAQTPLKEMRKEFHDLEPRGAETEDFAVPVYLDWVYSDTVSNGIREGYTWGYAIAEGQKMKDDYLKFQEDVGTILGRVEPAPIEESQWLEVDPLKRPQVNIEPAPKPAPEPVAPVQLQQQQQQDVSRSTGGLSQFM